MASNEVTYDGTTFDGDPYRSEALYRPDLRRIQHGHVKPGEICQVIPERGGPKWVDATYLCSDDVPHSDGSCQRYMVRINGERQYVSEDRIRVKP